ncbi:MAG: phosphoribosylaminoimidazolesuccinocarboxamide synthase [Leptospirales bacterium]|nr:phosphoribosylaminoimidazolesuccinocarboxamide synthase [Leptospirales bacterium]
MSALPEPFYRGKVRDLYSVDERSMLVAASDRLSAFDVVFDQLIPGKGAILTRISTLWFQALRRSGLMDQWDFEDHLLSADFHNYPPPFNTEELADRSMYVRRTQRVDFECVVRGFLAGSAWKEYSATGAVCEIALPSGLQQSSRLPGPIFTPATKAPLGDHDMNVGFAAMAASLPNGLAERLRDISVAIYQFAAERMGRVGILLCDTKFEFGILNDRILLIDEALTPDSSRYWESSEYSTGASPAGFDKQFIRDYVESIGWNKTPPAPALPQSVIDETVRLYRQIEMRIEQALSAA